MLWPITSIFMHPLHDFRLYLGLLQYCQLILLIHRPLLLMSTTTHINYLHPIINLLFNNLPFAKP